MRRIGRFTVDDTAKPPDNITGRVKRMGKVRGLVKRLLGGDRQKTHDGNMRLINQINEQVNYYRELMEQNEDVVELTRHSGFQKLLSEQNERIEADGTRLPEYTLKMFTDGDTKAVVVSLELIMWRNFVGVFNGAVDEHEAGHTELQRLIDEAYKSRKGNTNA